MMTNQGKPRLHCLTTGIPNLDSILGGGVPEYSFNLVAGEPGSGKTTLCHQIAFANASSERPALYFTVIGEPPLKMLRYQQQFTFFDPAKVNKSIHFINLGQEAANDLGKSLKILMGEVEPRSPSVVIIDSFRSLTRLGTPNMTEKEGTLQTFLEHLAHHLTSFETTTFMVGEFGSREPSEDAIFTIADGILGLSQNLNRNSMVRKIQAVKMRGQDTQPGLHTFRITQAGLEVFPRMVKPIEKTSTSDAARHISTGIAGLDEMLGGGTVAGSALLIAGPAGSGKSTVAIQFLGEGVRENEPGVLAMFEETPSKYVEQAAGFGLNFQKMADQNMLKLVYLRPLDLSVDETLHEIQRAVEEIGAKRVVIDSLTGLEIALAPTFEEDFRESLYRLIGALTGAGVTILMTVGNHRQLHGAALQSSRGLFHDQRHHIAALR